MDKELEEAKSLRKFIKEMKRENHSVTYNKNNDLLKDIETVLTALEKYEKQLDLDYVDKNYIPKQVIEKKMIIDKDKLNHSTNGILAEMYKARITLEQELLKGK